MIGRFSTGAAPPDFRVPAAQLTLAVDDPYATPGATVRRWFESGLADLGGELGARLLTEARDRNDRTPGAVTASLLCRWADTAWDVPWSPGAWHRFLQLVATVPVLAALDVRTNDERGRPGRPFLSITCVQPGGDPRWRVLGLEQDDPALHRTAAGQGRLVTFLRSAAEQCNPSYGEISYASRLHQSALETGLGLLPQDTVASSRHRARGYAWIFVLAEELGTRLGDLGALRDTGAFDEVATLAGGGWWLRATPRWDGYGPAEAARVFRVVAPVLLPGRPVRTSANVLADADAADWPDRA